ncbi:JmjC domain-containing protein [Nocardia arthritidis]|uniref:JmjC domain-containing protein n=1 Tax=Nocardia arthritidis TaxID=228602 RepID=UPI0023B16786|nr:cupin domain-containing protein [Nocardia arthritidis]
MAEFAPFALEAAEAFRISAKSAKCQIFCNRPGAVTAVHFDPIDVITVQLTGRKTWRVAPNAFAPAPLEAWSPKEPVPPILRIYSDGATPTGIPDDATEYVLEPGAVLHVPRGYWHETSSDQDSISIHILLIPPLRLDFLLALLRNELLRETYWRESVYDFDDSNWHQAALLEFADALGRINVHDFVRPPITDRPVTPVTSFVRAGQACITIDTLDNSTAQISVTAYGFREITTATLCLDRHLLPACQWLDGLRTTTSVAVDDILIAAPHLSKPDAQQLLALFEQTRLIRRTD